VSKLYVMAMGLLGIVPAVVLAGVLTPVATDQSMPPTSGPSTGTGRDDAAALLDPERRQTAFCRLLDARRYHAPPPYTEGPCEPVDDVVVAPQPDGDRLFLVFHNAPVPDGGISLGDARGGFTMIDANGFIIPVPDGANYLGEHDRLLAPAGDSPLVMVQVYGHAGGNAFGADGWEVQVLHATAVVPGARTLAVALGPPAFGFEDGCRGYSWWWRSRDVDRDGVAEIEIGPRIDADDNITPRAVYRWSTRARRYSGPGGSVAAGFRRLPDRGPDCAIGKAAEAFAREHRRRGLTHDPTAVRRPDCVHGTIPAGEPIP
jgi:hypothetical protein